MHSVSFWQVACVSRLLQRMRQFRFTASHLHIDDAAHVAASANWVQPGTHTLSM